MPDRNVAAHTADARDLRFECQPGCGFCCTARPLVAPHEAPALGARVVRSDDGTLRIPLLGHACSALQDDRGCGVYEARPAVCRLYPYQVHAGRRIQVSISLACPGVGETGDPAEDGASRVAELALAQPGAPEMAQRAREVFTEIDRRMKEWEVAATPDKLRSSFLPHVARLAQPGLLPAFFAGLTSGELVLASDGARSVNDLFDTAPDAHLADLYAQGATDAFDEPENVIWVEPDHAWTRVEARETRVRLMRFDGADRTRDIELGSLAAEWTPGAADMLASYLTRLMHRDHTEGAALWLVDASGYQVTPAAAYGRVLGEAALQVALRAELLAADLGVEEIDGPLARRGLAAYETAFHSLPTLGSIL